MEPKLPLAFEANEIWRFATALLIGALVGIEREKTKGGDVGTGGLRTFILVALVGAVAGWLARLLAAPWLIAAALAAIAAPLVAGYVLAARVKPQSLGITTEVAAVATCLVGAMATLGHPELAVVLGIATAAVLAYKGSLHGAVARLGWDDVYAGLRLLIATFVVLPLLPNRALDPWGALNPFAMWLLVLLISGLSLVGYVGARVLGPGRGALFTGLTGGLVSSTAVTLAFARQSATAQARGGPPALAAGVLVAWCIMFGRVLVEVIVVNPALVPALLAPFAAMAAVAGAFAWRCYRRTPPSVPVERAGEAAVELRNPFSLTAAARFAAFFAVVLLVVRIVREHFSGGGIYVVAAIAGLTDVDAITLSMARMALSGDADVAAHAIVIASLTNTVVKCGMVLALAAPALRRPIAAATAATLAAGLAALALT